MTLSFAAKPVLPGDRVTLRPVTVQDVPGLLELIADPESSRLTATRVAPDPDLARRWYATRADHDDRLDLAIVENAGGSYVGEALGLPQLLSRRATPHRPGTPGRDQTPPTTGADHLKKERAPAD